MRIIQHLVDPPMQIVGQVFKDETLSLEFMGAPYGRFLFTKWSPIVISHCVFLNTVAREEK
jgi:hypothetical protein